MNETGNFKYSCLTYNSRYHLKDVIVGKIYFLLVRIKIKHMEIQIIKRETTGTGMFVNKQTNKEGGCSGLKNTTLMNKIKQTR